MNFKYRRSSSSDYSWALYLILVAVFVVVEQVVAHSISESGAINAIEALGYTNVEVTERHTFFPNFQGCGTGDIVKFDVTGVDPRGVTRTFYVCDGIFKGATVRFD